MGYKDEWSGTRKELNNIIEESIDNIRMDLDLRLSDKEMKKLFCEAFSRNLVQSEIKDMIQYIIEEDENN